MTDDNVVVFPGQTVNPIPPEQILDESNKSGLREVLVIGWTKDDELYLSSSTGKAAEMIFLLELAKTAIMDIVNT